MRQSNASWKQWSSHPALLLLLHIPLSSALHTSCYSIAHVIPIICICQCTPLSFEGLLCLACKTIKNIGNWCLASRAVQRKDQSCLICIVSVCEAVPKCYKVTHYSTTKGALLSWKVQVLRWTRIIVLDFSRWHWHWSNHKDYLRCRKKYMERKTNNVF